MLFAGSGGLAFFVAGYLLILIPGLFGKSIFHAADNAPRAFLVLLPFANALAGIYLGLEAAKNGWASLRSAIRMLFAIELGIVLLMTLVT